VAAPCKANWVDEVGTMAFLPHLLWLFVLPEAVLVSTPLLLLYMARPGQWQGGPVATVADAVVVAALCWGLAAVVVRLRVRRRQRSLLRDAAGGLTALAPPAGATHLRHRGLVRYVTGVLVCAGAAALITTVVADNSTDDRMARTATTQVARVVAYSGYDYSLTVRLADGDRHRFGVLGDYRGEHTVRVLVHGDWIRLASEPYGDRSGRQAIGLALAGLGLTLLGSGLFARGRAAAVHRDRVPVLRVLTRRRQGRTEVFAADDVTGSRPVLSYHPPATEGRAALRQALLYGAVSEGGELVLASATESGQWLVEANTSPIRAVERETAPAARKRAFGFPAALPGGPTAVPPVVPPAVPASSEGRTPTTHRTSPKARPSRAVAHRLAAEGRVRHALATMGPATGPVRWQAGPVARVVGVLILALGVAMVVPMAMDSRPWWQTVVVAVWTWFVVETCIRMTSWRITADAAGLHARGLLRTHDLPWADVSTARYTVSGELIIRCLPGVEDLRVGGVGMPLLEAWWGRPGRAAYAAAEITAMVREPGLRPKPLPVADV
jgi:hypothetical protein